MRKHYALLAIPVIILLGSCTANFTAMDPNAISSSVSMSFSRPSVGAAVAQSAGVPQPMATGDSQKSGIISAKVYISSIVLVGDGTPSGSGFNAPSEPWYVLYQNLRPGQKAFNMDAPGGPYTQLQASNDTKNYLDLMDDADVAKLSATMPLIGANIGTYKYLMVNAEKWLKIKAAVPVSNGITNYTHNGTLSNFLFSSYSKVGDADGSFILSSTSLTNGPAEEIIIGGGGGGSGWARLLNPFKVTDDDLRKKTKFKMYIAFDPAGFIQACDSNSYPSGGCTLFDAQSNGMVIGTIDVAPVVYREGQHVVRYTYEAVNVPANSPFRMRIEVFSVLEDKANPIYAVLTRSFAMTNTQSYPAPGFTKISEMDKVGSTYTFYSPTETSKYAVISGFTLLTNMSGTTNSTMTFGQSAGSTSPGIPYYLIARDIIAQ